MNLLKNMMSYEKTSEKLNINGTTKNCNCVKCISVENVNVSEKREIVGNFKYADDFLIKVENYRLMRREYEILNTMNLEYWYKDVKTKWFIFRALWIHGNKYDYHKTKYIKYKEKVEITCRVKGHKLFPQTPSDHLNGHGCSECGGSKKMTKEEFIEKANKVHGEGRYDYSEVDYKGNKIDVWIICHKHNESYRFPQTPNEHLQGNGCPICAGNKKLTLKEFIEKSNKIHGIGRYDYSKVNYINNYTEVIIICPNHDEPYEFPQKPTDHLSGKGCPLCCEKSKGEIKIRLFLTSNDIQFEREKRFKDCRDKYPLPFDFYIPKYNLCIEFDGIQHFNPSSFVYGNTSEKEKLENFEYIQRHDRIKNEYCKKNGITLLRFNNLKTVKQELAEYFQNYGIIEQTIF